MNISVHRRFLILIAVSALALGAMQGARAELTIQALGGGTTVIHGLLGTQAVQPDGKILVSGWNAIATSDPTTVPDFGEAVLRRYLPDGVVDPSFDASALHASEIEQILPLANGQTLILAVFDSGGDADDAIPGGTALVRLNADGSRAAAFASEFLTGGSPSAVYPLTDGGALVELYDYSSDDSDSSALHLIRVTSAGHVDASFQPTFPLDSWINSLEVLPESRILLTLTTTNGESNGNLIVRLRPNGSRDPVFMSGLDAGADIDASCLLSDGRLLLAVSPDDDAVSETLVRLNADGSVDAGFSVTLPGSIDSLTPLASGAALAFGDFGADDSTSEYGIRRIDPSGAVGPLIAADPSSQWSDPHALPASGFVAASNGTTADGMAVSAIGTFNDAGVLLSRVSLTPGDRVDGLTVLPSGAVYAIADNYVFANPGDGGVVYETGNGGFSPPPAGGVSTVKDAPVVTISVLRGQGFKGGWRKVKFLLTRTGDTSTSLRVGYTVKGSAVQGRDYVPLAGRRIIKAGRSTAKIKVRPIGALYSRVRAGSASVKLTLVERHSYYLGAASVGKIWLYNHRPASKRP